MLSFRHQILGIFIQIFLIAKVASFRSCGSSRNKKLSLQSYVRLEYTVEIKEQEKISGKYCYK